MNYYANLDPYLIRERNERLAQEVSACRLEERLRRGRERRASRLDARAAALSLLRRARLSG